MTPEQAALFDKLTRLQKKVCLNLLNGMGQKEAYINAGGKAKDASMGASVIISNYNVSNFMNVMEKAAAEAALCTAEDIVLGLMREAGLGRDVNGKPIPPPSDACQTGRVSAYKALSEFTGGFDKNKKQVEHSGYISRPLSELYGDDG